MGVADILVGPIKIYHAPVGTTLPSRDSIAYGVAWGGSWTALGYTKAPLTCAYKTEEFDVIVEQVVPPVKRVRTREDVTLETIFAEFTGANLSLAADGTLVTAPAGTGTVGYDEVDLGGTATLAEYAWGFEGLHVTAAGVKVPARVFVYKGTATLNGELEFGKGDYVGIPLQVKGLADTDKSEGSQLMKFQKVTAPAA